MFQRGVQGYKYCSYQGRKTGVGSRKFYRIKLFLRNTSLQIKIIQFSASESSDS